MVVFIDISKCQNGVEMVPVPGSNCRKHENLRPGARPPHHFGVVEQHHETSRQEKADPRGYRQRTSTQGVLEGWVAGHDQRMGQFDRST
jgi:hypothetical protein